MKISKGMVVDGYRFVSELGEGATSRVWKVVKDGVAYAAKVFNNEDEEYFRKELAFCGRVESRHIIRSVGSVYKETKSGRGVKRTMIVLYELCGCSLSRYVERWRDRCDRAVWTQFARHVGRCLVEGVEAVHAAGMLHCDLKPGNVMLVCGVDCEPSKVVGMGWPVRLNDFGAWIGLDSVATSYGTAGYMSPEAVIDVVCGVESDVWSIALTVWYVFVGKDLFRIDDRVETICGCEDLLVCNGERAGSFYESYKYLCLIYKLLGRVPERLRGGIGCRFYNVHGAPIDDAAAKVVDLEWFVRSSADFAVDESTLVHLIELVRAVLKYEVSERAGLQWIKKSRLLGSPGSSDESQAPLEGVTI